MKIERHSIQACCGRKTIIFKIDKPIDKLFCESLNKLGFKESEHFTKAGILYVDNLDFIITGPFGSDKLQIKCKKQDCEKKLNDFENLLHQIG
jgi:hypothetical protein